MILRRETLEDILDRLEQLYQDGKAGEVRRELKRARKKYPQDLLLMEWEATLANDEGRHGEALACLDAVLAVEPGRRFARREKTSSLLGLGQFAEALAILREIGPETPEDAGYHFDLALCLDRLEQAKEADREFKKASRLDREEYPMPLRLSSSEFDETVAAALDEIPEKLRAFLDNVIVEVMEYPRIPPLEPGLDPFLLGLYVGVPRTERTQEVRDNLDRIFIFKRNLELEFSSRQDLKQEIRKTVIHEIAHHFGLGEEEMGEYA
jgi:predicted Zn-dependent protease with MMP-like domain